MKFQNFQGQEKKKINTNDIINEILSYDKEKKLNKYIIDLYLKTKFTDENIDIKNIKINDINDFWKKEQEIINILKQNAFSYKKAF